MSRTVYISETVVLTLTLEKTETGKYPQAKVYTSTDSLHATVNLSEVDNTTYPGIYKGTFVTPSSRGDLYAIYRVFTDGSHTTLDTDQDYHVAEEITVTDYTVDPGAGTGSFSHTDTIIDENTSVPVEGANIYIYSDANRLSLVASTTTTSTGTYASTLYADTPGTFYRRIVASGRPVFEDSVTFS